MIKDETDKDKRTEVDEVVIPEWCIPVKLSDEQKAKIEDVKKDNFFKALIINQILTKLRDIPTETRSATNILSECKALAELLVKDKVTGQIRTAKI